MFSLKLEDPVQALEARKSAKLKRVYYDLEDMLATNPSGNMPYTPSIPLLYGMREALRLLKAEGMENVVARHHRCAASHSWDGCIAWVTMHVIRHHRTTHSLCRQVKWFKGVDVVVKLPCARPVVGRPC